METLGEAMAAYSDQNYTKAYEFFHMLATKERNAEVQLHLEFFLLLCYNQSKVEENR